MIESRLLTCWESDGPSVVVLGRGVWEGDDVIGAAGGRGGVHEELSLDLCGEGVKG